MKKTLSLLLAAVLLLGGIGLWTASAGSARPPKDLKPVAAVSLSSYDKTLDNLALLGRAAGCPELTREMVFVLKLIAIQQGLTGPNKTKPWGIAVQAEGESLTGCAFVPASDLAKLAEQMEPLLGKAESLGGGVYRVRNDARPIYVKQNGDWAFFAYRAEDLDAAPDDPMAFLDGLNTQYDAAVRVHVNNLLPKHRQQLFQWITGRVDACAKQKPHEPNRLYAIRKQLTDEMTRSMVATADDVETLTLGWTLDTDAQKTALELDATARDGSQTAQRLASLLPGKSQFTGFPLPDAALAARWNVQLPPLESKALDAMVEAVRTLAVDDENNDKPKEPSQLVKQLGVDLTSLLAANARSGRIDGGMALLLKPDAVTVLAGGYVADCGKLDEMLKQAADSLMKQEPRAAEWIKADAANCQSVRLHTVSIPIPPKTTARKRVAALIGDHLDLAIGVGPQSVYGAIGREPLAAVQRVIERSATNAQQDPPAIEISFSTGVTAQFLAANSKNERTRSLAAVLSASLEPSGEQDHLRFIAKAIPRGVRCRLEVEESVLKLIGRLGGHVLESEEGPK